MLVFVWLAQKSHRSNWSQTVCIALHIASFSFTFPLPVGYWLQVLFGDVKVAVKSSSEPELIFSCNVQHCRSEEDCINVQSIVQLELSFLYLTNLPACKR